MKRIGLVVKARQLSRNGVDRLHFSFQIGQKPVRPKAMHGFEPLPISQVQALREYMLRTGKRPRVVMAVYANGEIREEKFYPFGVNDNEAGRLKAPLKQGIGASITSAVAAHLAASYPGHFVRHARSGPSWIISPSREAQLKAMGIALSHPYPTSAYRDIINHYLEGKRA